jgi:hypothetical protein
MGHFRHLPAHSLTKLGLLNLHVNLIDTKLTFQLLLSLLPYPSTFLECHEVQAVTGLFYVPSAVIVVEKMLHADPVFSHATPQVPFVCSTLLGSTPIEHHGTAPPIDEV